MNSSIIQQIEQYKIVPVVKLDRAEDAVALAKALVEGGLPLAEITFRTAAAAESIRQIRQSLPEMLVGAGTVVNTEQAEQAVQAGAKFLVSPGFSGSLAAWAAERGIALFPGVCTPSEIMQALPFDLPVLKFFPASQMGGLPAIRALAGPFPQVRFMPTGGVNASNICQYLADPHVIACGGSWMVKDTLIREGRFDEITRLTREAVALVMGG